MFVCLTIRMLHAFELIVILGSYILYRSFCMFLGPVLFYPKCQITPSKRASFIQEMRDNFMIAFCFKINFKIKVAFGMLALLYYFHLYCVLSVLAKNHHPEICPCH